METPANKFSELIDVVKSWIPWRSQQSNLSRNFWMPDRSCRVCYECDCQFGILNRKHHCRLCGRVFCKKCTSISVPLSSDDPKSGQEDGERIRVCNYCFRQCEQHTATADNGIRVSSPGLGPSSSATSLVSMNSSSTGNTSIQTVDCMSYSTGPYQHVKYLSAPSLESLDQSVRMEHFPNKQDMLIPGRNMDSLADSGDPSPNQFGCCMNRSDDDEYDAYPSDSESHVQHSDDFYGQIEPDEVDQGYKSNKVHPAVEDIDVNYINSPTHDDTEHASLDVDKTAEEPDNSYECDASSSMYGIEATDVEPVDFENNGLLWLPPEPEDEEDDREAVLLDGDDGDDATGEWGHLRSSNSFGSSDYQSRDQSSEEHKKAMKNVVEGHFRALITQLLEVENLHMSGEDDKESWLDIVTSLSWEVATLLKPDTSKGGGMDPGGYVKVKCIACGHRRESMVVKGVVFKKNVAHRRMASRIEKPRFLILGGALEYQRVTNLLSSFDTLLQQEMDHLKMAVAKIDAHHPNVLLVEKSVSRFAQDYLLAKDISLVLNIKRPLLERIARCTGAQIVTSLDHLSSQKLGYCDLFNVEKFSEEHGSAEQGGKRTVKTLMFFERCPKPLGCTVLLKGGNSDELKKVKHVVRYGVFAAYHLALETSFLADEGASLPELPLKSPIAVTFPDKPSGIERSISTIPGFTISLADKLQLYGDVPSPNTSDPTLPSDNFGKMEMEVSPDFSGTQNSQSAKSASTFISSSVDMIGFPAEKSNEAKHFVESQSNDLFSSLSPSGIGSNPSTGHSPYCVIEEKNKVAFGEYHEAETCRSIVQTNKDGPLVPVSCLNNLETFERDGIMADDTQIPTSQMIEKQLGSSDLGISHQINHQRDEHALSKEDFHPSSDHQSILVSLSTRCVWKGTVCERAHLFRIKYYGSFDKPLGRFLRDHLFDQSYRCRSCEMPSEAHIHCYTHRQGSITISVRTLAELEFLLPGERDGKIWMWHRCLQCPRAYGFPPATRRVVMSDAAWGLSFGKFLELSFSNHAAASRVASCGHSLHRDCLRFYGFGKMVACFRYASINVHSIYLPPPKLDFSYQHQDWLQKEANEVADQAEVLFSEVLNAMRQIAERRQNTGSRSGNMKVPESRYHIFELEELLQKEKTEFEKILKKDVRKGEPVIDILELNMLRKQLLFQSYIWDQRLIFAAGSDNSPHEFLSGFITNKEMLRSINNLVDFDLDCKPQRIFTSFDPLPLDSRSDESLMYAVDHQVGLGNHPNQPNIGQQRSDMEQDSFQGKQSNSYSSDSKNTSDQWDPLESGYVVRRALSDGQFPIVANLSDTLDAKWTGESGLALPDEIISDTSASIVAAVPVPASEDAEKRSGADARHSSASFLPPKYSTEYISRLIGMPVLNLFHSLNKIWGSAPRFDALSEYNPVYVSMFRELERQGGARLLLPIGVNDIVIPVFDEEPTSIISYALVSPDYHSQMSDGWERSGDSSILLPFYDSGNFHPFSSVDGTSSDYFRSSRSTDNSILSMSGSRSSLVLDPLIESKAMHVRVSFVDEGPLGKVKYTVTCYCAKHFDALRRTCCPSELDFIRSLSRCNKWGAQGGKSNVFFAKSLDERFIIKQVTKIELESFIKFAPEYFKYLSESIGTGSPTCLAKILGIYQITSKHMKGGKESRMDVLVMENLLFGQNVTRLYDLKGSSRSRYNSDSSGNNKVLLDQNLIEAMPTSPIFVGNKAKRLLARAVWNDTSFLASVDVMDYSLLVGIDEEKHELVLGIIDFMRQYTWDKHLETWVKASGILGGPKNASPTVVSPKQYKKRFRKAMSAYFLMVPDQWSPPTLVPSKSQSELCEDKLQCASLEP